MVFFPVQQVRDQLVKNRLKDSYPKSASIIKTKTKLWPGSLFADQNRKWDGAHGPWSYRLVPGEFSLPGWGGICTGCSQPTHQQIFLSKDPSSMCLLPSQSWSTISCFTSIRWKRYYCPQNCEHNLCARLKPWQLYLAQQEQGLSKAKSFAAAALTIRVSHLWGNPDS